MRRGREAREEYVAQITGSLHHSATLITWATHIKAKAGDITAIEPSALLTPAASQISRGVDHGVRHVEEGVEGEVCQHGVGVGGLRRQERQKEKKVANEEDDQKGVAYGHRLSAYVRLQRTTKPAAVALGVPDKPTEGWSKIRRGLESQHLQLQARRA